MLELQSHICSLKKSIKRKKHNPIPPWDTWTFLRSQERPLKVQCFGAIHANPLFVVSCSLVLIQTQANFAGRKVILVPKKDSYPWTLPVTWGSWLDSTTALVTVSAHSQNPICHQSFPLGCSWWVLSAGSVCGWLFLLTGVAVRCPGDCSLLLFPTRYTPKLSFPPPICRFTY